MSINKSINKGLIAVPWKFLSLFRFTSWIKWAPCNLHSKAVNPIWHGAIGKVLLFPFGLFDEDFHLNVPKNFLLKAEKIPWSAKRREFFFLSKPMHNKVE